MNTIELAQPDTMSAAERAAEIALILGAAIIRSYVRQNQAANSAGREIPLDCLPGQSVHTTPFRQERKP